MYVTLNLTAEPLDDGKLKINSAFGEESVWEDVGTSRRFSSSANPPRLRCALLSKDSRVEIAFELDHKS